MFFHNRHLQSVLYQVVLEEHNSAFSTRQDRQDWLLKEPWILIDLLSKLIDIELPLLACRGIDDQHFQQKSSYLELMTP